MWLSHYVTKGEAEDLSPAVSINSGSCEGDSCEASYPYDEESLMQVSLQQDKKVQATSLSAQLAADSATKIRSKKITEANKTRGAEKKAKRKQASKAKREKREKKKKQKKQGKQQLRQERRRAEIKVIFSIHDKDEDGIVTLKEIENTIQSTNLNVAEEKLKERFIKIDADASGGIDFSEFSSAARTLLKKLKIPDDQQLQEMKAFDWFDQDGNGFISAAELQKALGKKEVSDQDANLIFAKADLNSDDQLSWEEYIIEEVNTLKTKKNETLLVQQDLDTTLSGKWGTDWCENEYVRYLTLFIACGVGYLGDAFFFWCGAGTC